MVGQVDGVVGDVGNANVHLLLEGVLHWGIQTSILHTVQEEEAADLPCCARESPLMSSKGCDGRHRRGRSA